MCKKFCEVIFFWCHERLKLSVTTAMEYNGVDLFFLLKEIVEQGLGHVVVISSTFHFFKKTDFELYLFNG